MGLCKFYALPVYLNWRQRANVTLIISMGWVAEVAVAFTFLRSISCTYQKLYFCFLNPMPHMSFTDFVLFPPGHDRSVTDF